MYERSDQKGSVFLTEVHKLLLNMLKKGDYLGLGSDLTNLVFERVMKVKKQGQTPEFRKQLGYEIYFIPTQESQYKVERNMSLSYEYRESDKLNLLALEVRTSFFFFLCIIYEIFFFFRFIVGENTS